MANIGNFSVSLVIAGKYLIQIENNDIIELCIFEDIYDFCMTGYITFVDKIGHLEVLENNGGSIPLRIEWKESSPESEPVSKTFIVYYPEIIVSESQLDTGMKRVKWYFMDNMYTALTNKRQHSKVSWGINVKGSTIIEQLSKDIPGLEDRTKFKQFEETETSFNLFCTQNRTIAESIIWIKKRCKSTAGNAGYLFYNNSLGTNFVTMQTLINSKEREKDDQGNVLKYSFSGVDDSTNKILHWSLSPPENMEMNYLGGQTTIGYNENGKKIEEVPFVYKDMFSRGKNDFGVEPIDFGGTANALSLTDISNTKSHVTVESEPDPVKMYNLLTHNFISRYMLLNKANIVVRGNSSRYAGMIIDIDWKSSDPNAMTDKMMEGLWVVKSITHQFIPRGVSPPYRQLLVCIKPGYNQIESDKTMTNGIEKGIGSTSILKA